MVHTDTDILGNVVKQARQKSDMTIEKLAELVVVTDRYIYRIENEGKKPSFEVNLPDLPILYNVNVGHAYPLGVFPLGLRYEIDCDNKSLTLLESATA